MRTSKGGCSSWRRSALARRRFMTARARGLAPIVNTPQSSSPAPTRSAPATARASKRLSRMRRELRSKASLAARTRPRPSRRNPLGPARAGHRERRAGPRLRRLLKHPRRPLQRWPRSYPCPSASPNRWLSPGNPAAASSGSRSSSASSNVFPQVVVEAQSTPTSATMTGNLFLRSLSLLGFKTFARPTEIRFEGGVTAIVGPNGSGKTNIVDSVKWVLGSGHARDLRGRKMEEVIYAGGERRSRAAFAEVTVVFDNTAGRLPVDYAEVAITRRVQRDGESDYFLNGTRVRRRDLLHLLSSTGLTVDSYAIIDQRDIESIVVCTPAERRQLLEEAAQVRGVKTRRNEAAQRLAELAWNMLRLEDLRSEIEPRLEVLRAQAATAREAADASGRLEVLRGSMLWEEWREVRDSHRKAASQAQSLDRRLAEAREAAAVAEREFQSGRSEVQAAQDRRLARQRRLGELRLWLSDAEHKRQLAAARAENDRAIATAVRQEEAANTARETAARSLQRQLVVELEQAKAALEDLPVSPLMPAALDASPLQDARRDADQARRA